MRLLQPQIVESLSIRVKSRIGDEEVLKITIHFNAGVSLTITLLVVCPEPDKSFSSIPTTEHPSNNYGFIAFITGATSGYPDIVWA